MSRTRHAGESTRIGVVGLWLGVVLSVSVAFCVQPLAANLAELASRAVPSSGPRFMSTYRECAVCDDGATRLVRDQTYPNTFRYGEPGEREGRHPTNSSHFGLFCRLVAPDGTDIVGPMRLQEPAYEGAIPLAVNGCVAVARTDGGMLVYYNRPATYEEREFCGRDSTF